MANLRKLLMIPSLASVIFGIGVLVNSGHVGQSLDDYTESLRYSHPEYVQLKALNESRDCLKYSKRALTKYRSGKTYHHPNVEKSREYFKQAMDQVESIKDTQKLTIFETDTDLGNLINGMDSTKSLLSITEQLNYWYNSPEAYSSQRESIQQRMVQVDAQISKAQDRLKRMPLEITQKVDSYEKQEKSLQIQGGLLVAAGSLLFIFSRDFGSNYYRY